MNMPVLLWRPGRDACLASGGVLRRRRLFAAVLVLLVLLTPLAARAAAQGPAEGARRKAAGGDSDEAASARLPPQQRDQTQEPRPRQAYASLLYGDAFLLGMRVLGQSLRETGTTREIVALVTGDVSEQAVATLVEDGWKVQRVDEIENPGQWTASSAQRFPPRFRGVYTKLRLWTLTEYERVVYLDADTIATRALDELFLCDGLCGVLRHSERVNTGVLVLTPSQSLFQEMVEAAATTPSYTGGDQGFLNSFFQDFAAAPLFDPRQGCRLSDASNWRSTRSQLPVGRLPTVYNADLGLFVMNSNHWNVQPREIRVLHYTLATFKPWDWWSGWLMGENAARWQALRARLPPSPDGHTHGQTAQEQLARAVLLPLPLLLAVLFVRRTLWRHGLGAFVRFSLLRLLQAIAAVLLPHGFVTRAAARGGNGNANGNSNGSVGALGCSPRKTCSKAEIQQLLTHDAASAAGAALLGAPGWLIAAAAEAGVAAALAALGSAVLMLIPRQVAPAVGWVLAYEWTALLFVLLFSSFLHACHWRGRCHRDVAPAALVPPAAAAVGGAGRPWGTSLALFAVILSSLGLVPWWADILGVRSFIGKALATMALGALSLAGCTLCFSVLAARWYCCGAAEGPALAALKARGGGGSACASNGKESV